MVNPFKDIDWKPGRSGLRNFGLSLIIGFPIIAGVFALMGWWRHSAVPAGCLRASAPP